MNHSSQTFLAIEKWAIVVCLILLLPALLINIGLVPFIDDEAIRAIVAMEMDFSGDLITPTVFGELYLNKPPLYNWILLGSYKIFGTVNECTSRVPTVVFLLGYGLAIFQFYKSTIGSTQAIILALLCITTGRIFFYDSMLGLIDILFSGLMFSVMILSIKLAQRKSWMLFFVLTYSLTGIGFMLKTLPAIVFLGISILIILFLESELKKLFHPAHFIGIGSFLLVVAPYYFLYHDANGLGTLFERMFSESSKRTLVESTFFDTVKHIFQFPFDFLFHFLPWSIMVVYFFKKGMFQKIWQDKFLKANLCLLLGNVSVYWISPEIFARYLLMFPPLFFVLLLHLHELHAKAKTVHYRLVQISWMLVLIATLGLTIYGFFGEDLSFIKYNKLKLSSILIACVIASYFISKCKNENLPLIILIAILFRLGFDMIVLPSRAINGSGAKVKTAATMVVNEVEDNPLYLAQAKFIERTLGFYLMQQRNKPLTVVNDNVEAQYYFISVTEYESCNPLKSFTTRHLEYKYLLSKCEQYITE